MALVDQFKSAILRSIGPRAVRSRAPRNKMVLIQIKSRELLERRSLNWNSTDQRPKRGESNWALLVS